MGTMVTVGLVSVRSGRGAARVKGATRDIFAAIRQARSLALVTQQPAIITYSTEKNEEEVVAKVEITSAKVFAAATDTADVQTLTGPSTAPQSSAKGTKAASDESAKGESLEDVLFSPIDTDILTGMRLKVVKGDEMAAITGEAIVRTTSISVFSTTDYLLDKFGKKKEAEKKAAETTATVAPVADTELQEPVSIVWETNGRVEPHQVWIYADGQKPEQGLLIRVDRFGAAKVISGDGREDE